MKTNKIFFSIIYITSVMMITSCKKQDDFLNVKRNISDVRPSTIQDYQAVLDGFDVMNANFPSIGFAGTDNIYLTDVNFGILPTVHGAAYLWQKGDFYAGTGTTYSDDWNYPYASVEHANIVLDGLNEIVPNSSNLSQYNNVKGSALFYRSFYFYTLAQVFCNAYDKSSSNADLGIVLRLTSDVNKSSVRATVQQTYDQIISDLNEAITLLPVSPAFQMRPSQSSANALLAKVYLAMGDYTNAAKYASNSLTQFNTLLDYNSSLILPNSSSPFPAYPKNPEISFYAYNEGVGALFEFPNLNIANVDNNLYNSYDANDLRKSLYYTSSSPGSVFFKGSYSASDQAFSGIATNEVYLIRAESYARTGNISGALADINTLLIKRYKTGTYTQLSISDPNALLAKILLERRKELAFTGQLRWEDLRRLNKDSNYAITLTRNHNGQTYTLAPNDPRYVLPIPDSEIQLSGIQQNQR